MERGGTQGIQFVIQIVLARLLLPEDYGLIALVVILITIANVLVQSGLNTALIQKKNADETDFSSVFYLSLFIAGVTYIVLYLTAPFIADFYKESQLIIILRVLSIILFFNAVNSIQNAVISRTMQFKRLFYSSIGGIIVSGIIGITMAYLDYGVWALVGQQLSNNLIIMIILWFIVKWSPKFIFSITRIKSLFSFGWKLLFSSLLDTIYSNGYSLIIGKIYNPQMLGYYNQGNQIPSLIVNNIDGSIQSVMLPALSAKQDDIFQVKSMVRRSIMMSSFVIFPLMMGLAVCAEPLVKILLTDKWLPCVPFLQLMCISYAFWPIHTANLQAINALGRSDIFLKLEIIKKSAGLAALCISLPFGIYMMIGSQSFVSLISTIINSLPNRKLLRYSFKEQWLDIMPSFMLSLAMGVITYSISLVDLSNVVILTLQVLIGALIYFGLAYILKLECFNYLLKTLKNITT
jgi:O-antigen/teichoic acid export membrane protein